MADIWISSRKAAALIKPFIKKLDQMTTCTVWKAIVTNSLVIFNSVDECLVFEIMLLVCP